MTVESSSIPKGLNRGETCGFTIRAWVALPAIQATSATLNGSVYSGSAVTTAYFEWGQTTNLATTTTAFAIPPDLNTNTTAAPLTNLSPATVYYYRVAATNSFGAAYGQVRQFQTVAPLLLGLSLHSGGGVQLDFTGTAGGSYDLLFSTNLTLWSYLGPATNIGSNNFRFVESSTTDFPARFYRVLVH